MSHSILPSISVQPDWEEVTKDVRSHSLTEEDFWLSCYQKGQPSVHAKVRVQTPKEGSTPTLQGMEGVQVESLYSRSFRVSCPELFLKDINVVGPRQEYQPLSSKEIRCIDVSPHGKLYAAASGSDILIGQIENGHPLITLHGHVSDVTAVRFFPSNQVLLSGASDFQAKIWSVLEGTNPMTLIGHTSAITDIAIIGIGKNVLTSSRDGTVRLWHCGTGTLINVIGRYSGIVHGIQVIPLPENYSSACPTTLDERESETADQCVLVALHDGTVRGIHLGSKEELFSTPTKTSPITAITYDAETNTLVTGDEQGVVQVFSLSNPGLPQWTWQRNGHTVTAIVIQHTKQGRVLCIASADGSIYQTNPLSAILSGSVALEAEYTGNELEPVYGLCAIPPTHTPHSTLQDQRILACGRDGSIKLY
ncbi:WD40-repeat-containing domain protein [Spinellus fusiger]|nr:WD40-repeat-containing domain protein [Spinellus fusiger]